MKLLIGVDIGTTKTSVVALDADGGGVAGRVAATNPAALPSAPEACEYDAQALVDAVLGLIGQVVARAGIEPGAVAGIGVTGQMHGVVLADANGRALTPLINWQDQRGRLPAGDGAATYAEEVARRLGAAALARAGCAPATGYGAVTLFRLRQEQGLPAGAVALTIHDFLVRNLTGVAATDPTDAASWGVFDVAGGADWLPEAADALDLPLGLLPPVMPTGSIAGGLTGDTATASGLPEGVPVAVALGDNQASFIGSVPSFGDSLLLNLGTGGQMCVTVDHFARAAALETRPLVAGQWLLVGASLCAGRAYQLLAQFFSRVGRELFGAQGEADLYELMNALAEQAGDDAGGLRISPLFNGTRAEPALRAAVTGLDPENFTPAHFARAMVAGMAEELLALARLAQAAGAQPRLVVGSGNAVRRNPVLRREIERQAGLPLRLPPHEEEAAIGAALTAGVAVGLFPTWRAAAQALYANSG